MDHTRSARVTIVVGMADLQNNFGERLPGDIVILLDGFRRDALQCLYDQNYSGAREKATACLLIMATIPDGTLAGLATQTWNRQGVVLFLDQLDKMEAAAAQTDPGGMLIQGYEYSGIRGGSC